MPKPIFVEQQNGSDSLPDELRKREEAVAELEAWRSQTTLTLTPDQSAASAALTDEEVNRLVHELRGRS